MIWKTSDGQIVKVFPSDIELPRSMESLDSSGIYYWSIRKINDTKWLPGIFVEKWEESDEMVAVVRSAFRSIPNTPKPTAIAVEYYYFTTNEGIDSDKHIVNISTDYTYVIERCLVGQKVRIGPNIHGDTFWGTIKAIHRVPSDENQELQSWNLEFNEYFNTAIS